MQSGTPIQPNNSPPPQNSGNGLIACPYCAEEIKAAAYKCKHCGEWLYKGATPAAHASNTPVSTQAKKGLSSCSVIGLTILTLFGFVLYFGVMRPMMERAAHQKAISPSGPVKHGTGRMRKTIAALEKTVANDPELLHRVRELKAENEAIENSDDIEKHKAFLQKLQQFQQDLEDYSPAPLAPFTSANSTQSSPNAKINERLDPNASVNKKVLEADAAKLWHEIKGRKEFDMIARIKGSGTFLGCEDIPPRAFVKVNKKWHLLSLSRKKEAANLLFKRWQIISQESGRYATLAFQHENVDDQVASCAEEYGCEQFKEVKYQPMCGPE